ncbi:MAG: helix-turn-helix domain-containing protein [Muribaculaceae bacterium]|nr:helix-turn-helix domain-containing protein [Muribaculaceae bacterium]
MSRIDLVRLRKRAGMSQRALADLLQVRPSFLSAIENGRSRMPEEKLDRLHEIFELDSFDDYIIPDIAGETGSAVPPHTHPLDQGDSLTQLLTHFHDLAHRSGHASAPESEYAERIEFLVRRNDRLSDRIDDLRDEVDALRRENLQLKELLLRSGKEIP